jgi:hypothetical protein
MTMSTSASTLDIPADNGLRNNPVFWIMWLLPVATVFAGFATLAIALGGADRALPVAYHWEGEGLDRDFARARNAAGHGMQARLTVAGGTCSVTVIRAPREAAALELLLTHRQDAGLDRVVRLERSGPDSYRAACAGLVGDRWRIALGDSAGEWAIRASVDGSLADVTLRARNPDGSAG